VIVLDANDQFGAKPTSTPLVQQLWLKPPPLMPI
jgi:hypothetical protein